MGTAWRLILDTDRDAAMNMAVDEAIMLAHTDGRCPPTLRLYSWLRPSISLGYLQDACRGGLKLERCREHSVEVVRRLTGGRAVLHGHDLTFSITIDREELPADNRSVLGSHSWLMGGIVAGLRSLGIDARLGSAVGPSSAGADCFAHAAACDVVADGRKVAGSAQVRRHGVILEQGSIPYCRPEVSPSLIFGSPAYTASDFREGLERRALETAISTGFRIGLGIDLIEGTLSVSELECARNLAETRFGSEEWTFRRGSAFVDIRK